jgi:LPS-assembly lipoprotein
MLWCSRAAPRNLTANLMRLCAVMALAGLTAGCFQPLYASRSLNGGTPIGTALAQVQIERIDAPNGTPEARLAVELQNALDFELTGGGGLISPTHRIKVRMTTSRSSLITDVLTGRVEAEITGIDSSFTLTDVATGKAVLNGRTFARVSSDYPGQQQRFARVRARLEAEDRAAKVIAEAIRTRLASFFVAGT